MATVNLHSDNTAVRMRAGVGLAGMFVVACFCAAMFFSAEQSQAADQVAAVDSSVTNAAELSNISTDAQ